ncbi:MAG: WYL domain-containing protein [Erysipelotrichaceae bacterium]|nr:WYL domain-containing protein [Erysipelotrichaceae bacterium]
MGEKKQNVLALLDILRRYSDQDHILSAKEIREILERDYGMTMERRTLYANIENLIESGYPVSNYEDNGRGYFLEERSLEKAEVLLLCNAIHSSHFISQKQSDQLIKKLLSFLSKYQQKEYRDKVYMPNSQKTDNHELLYNIETVSEAIRDRKAIQFIYCHYDKNKKLVPKRENVYEVEPRYIVYSESRAYMVSTSRNHEGFAHYRLDKMKKAVILEEKARPLSKDSDAYEYAKNKLFMYSGEMERVLFRCRESIMDQMIDLFGSEVRVEAEDGDSFLMSVRTSRTGAKYLAQQYLDSMEILEPEDLREEFKETIKDLLKRYE